MLTCIHNVDPAISEKYDSRLFICAICQGSVVEITIPYSPREFHDRYEFHWNGDRLNLFETESRIAESEGHRFPELHQWFAETYPESCLIAIDQDFIKPEQVFVTKWMTDNEQAAVMVRMLWS
jgi:hypothetical protein